MSLRPDPREQRLARLSVTVAVAATAFVGCPVRQEELVGSPLPQMPVTVDFSFCGSGTTSDARLGASLASGHLTTVGPGGLLGVDYAAGAPGADDDRGAVCLYRGRSDDAADLFAVLDGDSCGFTPDANDLFGFSVAIGDFDCDGDDDLAVGTPQDDTLGAFNNGSICFLPKISGETFGPGTRRSNPPGPDGAQGGARFGNALATGDFNGDGCDDLAIGSYRRNIGFAGDAGKVYVVLGSGSFPAGGFDLDQPAVFAGAANEDNDQFGEVLATGDLDGDGLDELIIGAPHEDVQVKVPTLLVTEAANAGLVFVARGCADPGLCAGTFFTQAPHGNIESGDRFGSALAVADFDGDGDDDIAIGAPFENFGSNDDGVVTWVRGGTANLIRAGTGGLLAQSLGFRSGFDEGDDNFGFALAAGHFDGDGLVDLAIGAPGDDLAVDLGRIDKPRAGLVSLWKGCGPGCGIDKTNYFICQEDLYGNPVGFSENGDGFGTALVAADTNGDALDDLVIGAPSENSSFGPNSGVVFLATTDASRLCLTGSPFTGHWVGTISSYEPVPLDSEVDPFAGPALHTAPVEIHLCELPGAPNVLDGWMTLESDDPTTPAIQENFDMEARTGAACNMEPLLLQGNDAPDVLNNRPDICGDDYHVDGQVDAGIPFQAEVTMYWSEGDPAITFIAVRCDESSSPPCTPPQLTVEIRSHPSFPNACVAVRVEATLVADAPVQCDAHPPVPDLPPECTVPVLWWEHGGPGPGATPGAAGGGGAGGGPVSPPLDPPPETCP